MYYYFCYQLAKYIVETERKNLKLDKGKIRVNNFQDQQGDLGMTKKNMVVNNV
jgi:hypothetical protein